jgi:hypothetical protein
MAELEHLAVNAQCMLSHGMSVEFVAPANVTTSRCSANGSVTEFTCNWRMYTPQVQALVAARGIALDKVACDPWAIHACPREWLGRRLMQVRTMLAPQPSVVILYWWLDMLPSACQTLLRYSISGCQRCTNSTCNTCCDACGSSCLLRASN